MNKRPKSMLSGGGCGQTHEALQKWSKFPWYCGVVWRKHKWKCLSIFVVFEWILVSIEVAQSFLKLELRITSMFTNNTVERINSTKNIGQGFTTHTLKPTMGDTFNHCFCVTVMFPLKKTPIKTRQKQRTRHLLYSLRPNEWTWDKWKGLILEKLLF